MARTTVKTLEDRIAKLEQRLDDASRWAKQHHAQLHVLEAENRTLRQQQDKHAKQLWWLQRVAKGIFTPKAA